MAKRKRPTKPTLPKGLTSFTPYYSPEYCPKGSPEENLQWRIHWREKAAKDRGLQKDFKQAAFEDLLFWFNAFCWCFEPRGVAKIRPFVTWPHQDPAFLAMDQAITNSEKSEEPIDLVLDKSRGQGATWGYLGVFKRRFIRDDLFSAGLVTRNEKLVDSFRDPDTLMWKVVWSLKMLPFWMLPEGFDFAKHRSLSEHSLANPANGSSIVGYSATGDVARGGRKTVFALDELAAFKPGEDWGALDSTQHVTNCRFLVSTYLGDSGAYYKAATEVGNAVKVILDWKDNPTQNRKLYRMVNNHLIEVDPRPGNRIGPNDRKIINEQHGKLRRRGYKIEGKIRNIWYNNQCLRPGATPRGIAQELDRDPHGSVSKVFASEALKHAKDRYCIPPSIEGRLVYDAESAEVRAPYISECENGELKLWVRPDLEGKMPYGSYVLGADISAGTAGDYTSNSVACVINRMTGEQVAEWASYSVPPVPFAYVCVSLARWFHGALIIPEANFVGGYLKTLVEEICYENVYYREVDIVGVHRKTQKPGFWMTNDDVKLKLFEAMQGAWVEGAFTPRSKLLVEECGQYEWKNGKIVHVGSTKTQDEGGKGKAHGDRTIAASVAWMGCTDEPFISDDDEISETAAPPGSMAERLMEYDRRHGPHRDPWTEGDLDNLGDLAFSIGGRTDPWQ